MNRRQFDRLLAASLLIGALPGKVLGDAAKPTVAVLLKSMLNEFFTQMANGAKAHHAGRSGQYELIVDGTQQETDYKAQEALIKRWQARKISALLVVPADSVAILPALQQLMSTGTLVINIDNKLDDRALAAAGLSVPFVGPSNFAGARSVGEFIGKKLARGSKVGLIEGPPAHINAKARSDGYREAMRAAGMEVVGQRTGEWVVEGGKRSAAELLQASPDIKALLCGNDNMAIGAADWLKGAGLADKVLVAGYDNIPAVAPYIADGRIAATADQFPAKQAEYALDLALKSLRDGLTQADLPSIVQTPVQLVIRR
ncbi:substrate-binding domain-containing protein [Chitinimonas sp.]|uniref:substrate-binding domain-containing protein n=1 Tax=Chitinimonas sp. TaxID=1934313 RepID=UPI0035ADABFC